MDLLEFIGGIRRPALDGPNVFILRPFLVAGSETELQFKREYEVTAAWADAFAMKHEFKADIHGWVKPQVKLQPLVSVVLGGIAVSFRSLGLDHEDHPKFELYDGGRKPRIALTDVDLASQCVVPIKYGVTHERFLIGVVDAPDEPKNLVKVVHVSLFLGAWNRRYVPQVGFFGTVDSSIAWLAHYT